MRERHAGPVVALAVAAACVVLGGMSQPGGRMPGVKAPRAAHLVIDLPSGRVVSSAAPDLLRTPVLPGSIAKIATLLAGLETRALTADTRVLCRRHLVVDSHSYTCSHPVLARPLSPVDALAQSCNYYFATLAPRVRRDAFDRALASMGLPPSDRSVPMSVAGLGLGGVLVTPEQLLRGFARLVTSRPDSVPEPAWELLREGLRAAAREGTAAVFAEGGVSALAKTGTAPMPGGGYQGLVVAVTPADRPVRGIVVLAPGASGADAARLAVALLNGPSAGGRPPAGDGSRLRIGRVGPDGRYHVEDVDIEEYVARAVAAEAAPGGGAEADKALAIVARTYALVNRSRHGVEGFDLCDLTHCQALATATVSSRVAAAATAGQVLYSGGGPAVVFYSASCGGQTERPSAVWPGAPDPPHLVSRIEPTCARDAAWSSEIAADDLVRALRQAGLRGRAIRNLAVAARTPSGRARRVRIEGFEPPEIDGDALRLAVGRSLGWQQMKSTLFDVARTARGYRFTGRGAGHGVGLCVEGAARMARAGRTAESILREYFPGTRVGSMRPSTAADRSTRVSIVLPSGEERAESEARDIVTAALRAIGGRTTLPMPGQVRIVFHDSVAAYTRATGNPWWTSGATSNGEIHLIPIDALRRRGLLAQALSHELAHVVVGDRLAGEPVWLAEGTAMFLSGESGSGDRSRPSRRATTPCPTDDEFRRSSSAAALRSAYAAAAACFAEQGRTAVEGRVPLR